MLKKRIIPVQLLLGGRLVKTVGFDTYRDVGDPVSSSRVYNSQYADELVLLNIDRGPRTIEPLLRLAEKVSEVCFMPLAFGGGIKSADDAEALIKNGADKVVVNTERFENSRLIPTIAARFGSQAVIASLDVRRDDAGRWQVFSNCGRNKESGTLEEHVEHCVEEGAGELLINSIDRDGTMKGYDIELIERVTKLSPVPVIACGGAGTYAHMQDAFLKTGVSALACGSLFNFGDNNPIRAKAFLSNYGLPFKKV